MPTRKQLSRMRETEFEFPSTRREDDPCYVKPEDLHKTKTGMNNIKQITFPSGEYLLVDVPEDANGFFIHKQKLWTDTTYPGTFMKRLPPGSWEIVGKGSEIKEEVWSGIVEEASNEYYTGGKDYMDSGVSAFHSMSESGHSWITSLGHKPESVLVLRKVK